MPIAFEAEFVNTDGEKALYRGILLPFSDDGENINFILGGVRWILEKDVTLDDSKPTIEELMRSISAGREDTPVQYDEAAIAAEDDAPDTVSEDYIAPEAHEEEAYQSTAPSTDDSDATGDSHVMEEAEEDTANIEATSLPEDFNEETALSEDDFDIGTEESASDETGEGTIGDPDLAADIASQEDVLDVVPDGNSFEVADGNPDLEENVSEDIAPTEAATLENETSIFTDAPGITRKDFVPEPQEEVSDEADIISEAEVDILAEPEQNDDSEIFTESAQADEALFDDVESENDAIAVDDNFGEIFDTEEAPQTTAEDNPEPVEENALSFVENLEKELYGHTDEIEIDDEEVLVSDDEETSEEAGKEPPSIDVEAELETETILEGPEEEVAIETTEDLIAEADDTYREKSTRDLTLNELLSEHAADAEDISPVTISNSVIL